MRRRTGIFLAAAVILLAFVTVTLLRRPPDPLYEGKRLSDWLYMYWLSQGPTREEEKPATAIRHIGTNALPLLLDWLNYEPLITRYPICKRLPNWILSTSSVQSVLVNRKAAKRAAVATDAFGILGDASATAIPELMRRASAKKTSARRSNSLLALARALAGFDHPPIPALVVVLSVPDPRTLSILTPRLRQLGTNAHPLVPLLVRNLSYADSVYAILNSGLLVDLRLDDLVVQELAKCLQDPDAFLRLEAMRALARFGEAASVALPALTNALSDPDSEVRDNAGRAIQKIAPKVSTIAPAR